MYSRNFYFYFFGSKIAIFFPRPPKKTSKLQKLSAHRREHSAPQNLKLLPFFIFIFVGLFDPLGSGSGSSPIKINADPDPKYCLKGKEFWPK
jgi:hypothetical protein